MRNFGQNVQRQIFINGKTCILASLSLRAIINVFIQVIFPNIITYLERNFNEEQNDINFKMKYLYKIGVNFNFIYQVSDAQMTPINANIHH